MATLTAEERCHIAARAASVYERADPVRRRAAAPSPDVSQPDTQALLGAWTKAYSPGDAAAFARRLLWDELTPEIIAAALDAPAVQETTPPEWTDWLARICDEAERLSPEAASPDFPTDVGHRDNQEPPFVELWTAVLRAARSALDPRVHSLPLDATPGARADLDRQLLRELAIYGELAVDNCYSAFLASGSIDRRTATPDSNRQYFEFIRAMLETGLRTLWTNFPVLGRQIAVIVDDWVEASAELFERLAADRSRIAAAFGDGEDPGPVEGIEAALSDPHDGRRRVAIVRFASGLRAVYKPRDLGVERALVDLLQWLDRHGFEPSLPSAHVIQGEGYGWVELVSQAPFETADAVGRYYRQTGGLMLLTHLLGSKDLHMENLVATAAGPVLIDAEMLLQPVAKSERLEGSCLATGLLSDIKVGPTDEAFDEGGLRGDGNMPPSVTRRRWRHLRSDAVHFVEEATARAPVKNAVMLRGERQPPDAFAAEIVDGFASAYRGVLALVGELTAADGPLARFRASMVRVIFRPTDQYALLSAVRNVPRYQRDAARHSTVVDVLHRSFHKAHSRPIEWPLAIEERRVVDALDVPRFVVPAAGRTVYSAGRPVLHEHYGRPALDAVYERIARLSEDDLAIERAVLSRALSESTASRLLVRFSDDSPGRPDDLLANAEWIGRELLAHAAVTPGRVVWEHFGRADRPGAHSLYDGTLGPALFLAALAAATGDGRWRNAARGALEPVLSTVEGSKAPLSTARIGGCSGLGSLVYGLASAGALIGDHRAVTAASRVAVSIDADRVSADRHLDIVDGAAGALLGLIALHAVTRDRDLLEKAILCGDHLVRSRVQEPEGWAWRSADGHRLIGFAHGAAGVATALTRLWRAVGDPVYAAAATEALRFVSRWFSSADASWPIAARGGDGSGAVMLGMNAWCHGAPGIALAGAAALDISPEVTILTQARLAMPSLSEWQVVHADHLCCGHLGRADVLATAGERLGRPESLEAARELAQRVVSRAHARQHFRLSTPGFEYRVFDPGLFRGLSGIGYELLRLAMPDRLPSILSFEPVGGPAVSDTLAQRIPSRIRN